MGCPRCRAEYEQIRQGASFAGLLSKVDAPDGLWARIEQSLPGTGAGSTRTVPWFRFDLTQAPVGLLAVLLILAAFLAVAVYITRNSRNSWKVNSVAGTTLIASRPIGSEGKVSVGESIETDSNSRARLYPGNIGEVEIEPDSKLRMLQSRDNEYRLSLEHGEVKAQISAPPRLFFVDTPSAVAVDLGCAYTLDVDPEGNGHIDVTAGWVELDSDDTQSMVPAEAACITRPGSKPGTPFFEDAPQPLKDAILKFDFGPIGDRKSALDTVLAQARKRDTLTVWHLLPRVGPDDRPRVYNRLRELVPAPEGVTLEGILQLNPVMLQEWFLEIQPAWFE